MLVFVLSFYILCSYYTLEACLFSSERCGGVIEGGETIIRIYKGKKSIFKAEEEQNRY